MLDTRPTNEVGPCAETVAEIARLCFLINARTDYSAFCDWSGHVNLIYVRITEKNDYREPVFERGVYLVVPEAQGWGCWLDTHDEAEALRSRLAHFLATNARAA